MKTIVVVRDTALKLFPDLAGARNLGPLYQLDVPDDFKAPPLPPALMRPVDAPRPAKRAAAGKGAIRIGTYSYLRKRMRAARRGAGAQPPHLMPMPEHLARPHRRGRNHVSVRTGADGRREFAL